MTPLLEQFLSEARDVLQGIGEKLMELETAPDDPERMTALFRMVHTLKGNSGLFEFPEMTRVLHAGEDLMDAVRHGRVAYSEDLADRLLDAMDFVGMLCDEIEGSEGVGASAHAADSTRLAASLRELLASVDAAKVADEAAASPEPASAPEGARVLAPFSLADVPESVRMDAHRRAREGATLHAIQYTPADDCFFQGEDPFFQARGTPSLLWGGVAPREAWPGLAELDPYRCNLVLRILSAAKREELDEYFRYMVDSVRILPVVLEHEAAAGAPTATTAPLTPLEAELALAIMAAQRAILALPIESSRELGRIEAASKALAGCLVASGEHDALPGLEAATALALGGSTPAPLAAWLDARSPSLPRVAAEAEAATARPTPAIAASAPTAPAIATPPANAEGEPWAGRRSDDTHAAAKSVKVDQVKIDRLMDLIGEMVVSKNALPYLAGRAESVFGSPELAREIKAQYAIINRIAEEMQDAIMQVRMMPVSFVFQRFPRLVRDTSKKLGKEVQLVLLGEETEADKNVIEALGDPLVHIVRNSLDHGFELPEARLAAGKPAAGTLTIRASQEADRVVIEITDDGKGIDPAAVKWRAYEKGLIDESALDRMSDEEAVNLVFLPGFSTLDVVSELSGRGVGMDVVRTAVAKVNGSIALESKKGQGTRIRLSLPLSMAVTNVMIVEADGQTFGMPMDSVVETVRVPRASVHTIKESLTTVLRGRVVPLRAVNTLLGLAAAPRTNAEDELAVLVLRRGKENVGLVVDDFRETASILLKPMVGVLAGLNAYSGSALMGDGSVLMVLDPKEMAA
jgi:two-component system chemotaxis sensor kinase CheA